MVFMKGRRKVSQFDSTKCPIMRREMPSNKSIEVKIFEVAICDIKR